MHSWRNASWKTIVSWFIDDKSGGENNGHSPATYQGRYSSSTPSQGQNWKKGNDRFVLVISLDLVSVSAGYGTNLLEKTPNAPRRSLKDLLPEVPEKALDLISNLIVFNPNHRLTAVEALEHPYVAEYINFLTKNKK